MLSVLACTKLVIRRKYDISWGRVHFSGAGGSKCDREITMKFTHKTVKDDDN